ncbi:hypothetical protein C8R44DRAFT_734865 [Mycena epipterygia]|nr:hypothetical protein C8R44DRAFT_734865 [Mycena epipterygia]
MGEGKDSGPQVKCVRKQQASTGVEPRFQPSNMHDAEFTLIGSRTFKYEVKFWSFHTLLRTDWRPYGHAGRKFILKHRRRISRGIGFPKYVNVHPLNLGQGFHSKREKAAHHVQVNPLLLSHQDKGDMFDAAGRMERFQCRSVDLQYPTDALFLLDVDFYELNFCLKSICTSLWVSNILPNPALASVQHYTTKDEPKKEQKEMKPDHGLSNVNGDPDFLADCEFRLNSTKRGFMPTGQIFQDMVGVVVTLGMKFQK